MKIKEIHVEFPNGKVVERKDGFARTNEESINLSVIPFVTDNTTTRLMFWGETVDIDFPVDNDQLDSLIAILTLVRKSNANN